MTAERLCLALLLVSLSIAVIARQQVTANQNTSKMSKMVGGISETKEPDETVQVIVAHIRPELESKLGKTFATYEPISYKSQLVNGVNYFIKIHIGNDQCIHVRAYRSFAGETALRAVQPDKQKLDEIEYFDIE